MYEIFATRRKYGFPAAADQDDPWRTIFDDLHDWFSGPRVTMLIAGFSVLLFALGTFYSAGQIITSTYFCFEPLDSRPWVLFLQVLGLVLDAVITVLLWRVLSWTRTMKLRFRALSSVLILSAISVGFVTLGSALFEERSRLRPSSGSLYGFDIIVDSIAFAALSVCAVTWMCETSPLLPASTVTILIGAWSSMVNAIKFGDWMHVDRAPILIPTWVLVLGAILFMYYHDVRRLFFVGRALITVLLVAVAFAATLNVAIRGTPAYPRHPISDLIFKAIAKHDRWVTEATTSRSLEVAAIIYQERHPGMVPPPNFDRWYEYAENTVVVDTFKQIDNDLSPFWSFKPDVLRKKVDTISEVPGVSTITVSNGKVTHSDAGDKQRNNDLEELSVIIGKFSAHLPDMILPINLDPAPRILPSWEEAHAQGQADLRAVADLISKRSLAADPNVTESDLDSRDNDSGATDLASELLSPSDFRQMLAQACAPGSPGRSRPQWDMVELCSSCVERHSKHAFLIEWEKSMETCEESDLKNLHEMFMTSPKVPPIRKLMPLFGASKTDVFKDMLIPIPRTTLGGSPDMKWDFGRRYDSLFWRGKVGTQEGIDAHALRGSQKYRFLHLFVNPSAHEEVTLLVPIQGYEESYGYERASAAEASSVAPFDVGVGGFSECHGDHCQLIKQVFGAKEDVQEPLEYRYVLQLDEEGGPPEQLMRTVRSRSVPFVSTIFRSWYTERLEAYLHFVPVDTRYHSLHSTYLYFTGTENRAKINGRETHIKGATSDGEWIAREGQKWVEKAIGEKDIEVYLFRLLLEWGRLIDDQRSSIGYRKTDKGEWTNIGWTKRETA